MKNVEVNISVSKLLLSILAIVFVAETLLMALLAQFGQVYNSLWIFLADAALLSAIVAPPIYLLIRNPFRRATGVQPTHATGSEAPVGEGALHNLDPLTKVLNRQAITVDLLEAVAHADRYGNRLSVAMADVDQLQRINDEHGKQAGDKVLQTVAMSLTDALRMPDRIGRYSTKDFLMVLPETNINDAFTIAERIRSSINDTEIDCDGKPVRATISIGITQFHRGEDIEHLLSRVTKAITDAKEKGSNQVILRES